MSEEEFHCAERDLGLLLLEDSEDQETGEFDIISGEWEEKDKKNEKNKNQSCDTKLILMETFDVVDMNKD